MFSAPLRCPRQATVSTRVLAPSRRRAYGSPKLVRSLRGVRAADGVRGLPAKDEARGRFPPQAERVRKIAIHAHPAVTRRQGATEAIIDQHIRARGGTGEKSVGGLEVARPAFAAELDTFIDALRRIDDVLLERIEEIVGVRGRQAHVAQGTVDKVCPALDAEAVREPAGARHQSFAMLQTGEM